MRRPRGAAVVIGSRRCDVGALTYMCYGTRGRPGCSCFGQAPRLPFVCTPNVSIALRHVPYHASAVKWSRRLVAPSSFLPCCCSPEASRVQLRGADPSSVVAAARILVLVAGRWTKWQVSHCPLWQSWPPGRGPVAPAATTCRGGLSSGLTQQLPSVPLPGWRGSGSPHGVITS